MVRRMLVGILYFVVVDIEYIMCFFICFDRLGKSCVVVVFVVLKLVVVIRVIIGRVFCVSSLVNGIVIFFFYCLN